MKYILTLVMILASFGLATAQTATSDKGFETYAGYQFVRINPDIRQPNFRFDRTSDLNGANVSTTYYVDKNVGFTGELGANFDTQNARTGLYTAMGGLTIKANKGKTLQPFIRGLVGASVFRADSNNRIFPTKNDLGFAFAVGGGLDIKVGKRLGLRVIQADYLQTNNYDKSQNNLRLGAGITF